MLRNLHWHPGVTSQGKVGKTLGASGVSAVWAGPLVPPSRCAPLEYNVGTGVHQDRKARRGEGVPGPGDRPPKEAEPIAVERHGKVIGVYIPVEPKRGEEEELKETLAHPDPSVKRVLEETGMTEDELAGYFDPSRPAPELPPDSRERSTGRG